MAVPKKKISKSRKRIRRSHHHLEPMQLSRCARCGSPSKPHAICDSCGYYRGALVLAEKAADAADA